MKNLLRTLFSPLLNVFEKGDEPYSYKPLNRMLLNIVGVLFLGLSVIVGVMSPSDSGIGGIIPIVVFSGLGLVCVVIGTLGNDRAVSKIWGGR